VRICRALLRGDEVLYREGKRERWIRFMHPDRGYINIKQSIPIVIAAQGPKALEVAGEVGDGWMAPVSGVEEFKQNFDAVKSAAKRTGRDAQNFSATMLRRPASVSRANRSPRLAF
jgi:alkanesulfonate monooxygenase SsuD/methylene tetrahydromethanopterin reductase-like flavin-dependent oxidoreductase (luciferase family)